MLKRLSLRIVALGYLVAVLIGPLSMVFWRVYAEGAHKAWVAVSDANTLHAFRETLVVTAIALPLNAVFGVVCALLIVRRRVPAAQQLAQPGHGVLLVHDRGARMHSVVGLDRLRAGSGEAPQHGTRRVLHAGTGQEARRLGDPAVEQHDQRAGGQAQQPQHAPAEKRLQQCRSAGRQQVASRSADAAQRHQQPAAMGRGNCLGHQGEGDRQQATGRGAHQKAHH